MEQDLTNFEHRRLRVSEIVVKYTNMSGTLDTMEEVNAV